MTTVDIYTFQFYNYKFMHRQYPVPSGLKVEFTTIWIVAGRSGDLPSSHSTAIVPRTFCSDIGFLVVVFWNYTLDIYKKWTSNYPITLLKSPWNLLSKARVH